MADIEKTTIDYGREHADLVETRSSRNMSRHFFEGERSVKRGDVQTTYLFQLPNESDSNYKTRLARAVIDPWVEKIVIARLALLFHKPPKRELPAPLDVTADDVDMRGTPADDFFYNVNLNAQVDGIRWVLVDRPAVPVDEDGAPALRSKKDETDNNIRAYFAELPADGVLDIQLGDDRRPLWITTKEFMPDAREPGTDETGIDLIKVWTRDEWVTYEQTDRGEWVEHDRGFHGLGCVPLVPFFGVKNSEFSGWPVTLNILPHIRALYNKESDLDWFETLSSHPIPYSIGPKKLEFLDSRKGIHLGTKAGEGTPSIGYLEPSGQGFQSLRETGRDLRQRIMNLALSEANKESAQVQAADSKREDRRIFDATVKTNSRNAQHSERKCWEIAAKWESVKDASKLSVIYNRDFTDSAISEAMTAALSNLVSASQLPRELLWEYLRRQEVIPEDVPNEELHRMIMDDLQNEALLTGGNQLHPSPDDNQGATQV